MKKETRFFWDTKLKTHLLKCLSCNWTLFEWDHALEQRHIDKVQLISSSHVCKGE